MNCFVKMCCNVEAIEFVQALAHSTTVTEIHFGGPVVSVFEESLPSKTRALLKKMEANRNIVDPANAVTVCASGPGELYNKDKEIQCPTTDDRCVDFFC